jgi:hypothetical protein
MGPDAALSAPLQMRLQRKTHQPGAARLPSRPLRRTPPARERSMGHGSRPVRRGHIHPEIRFTLSHHDDRMSGWICNFTCRCSSSDYPLRSAVLASALRGGCETRRNRSGGGSTQEKRARTRGSVPVYRRPRSRSRGGIGSDMAERERRSLPDSGCGRASTDTTRCCSICLDSRLARCLPAGAFFPHPPDRSSFEQPPAGDLPHTHTALWEQAPDPLVDTLLNREVRSRMVHCSFSLFPPFLLALRSPAGLRCAWVSRRRSLSSINPWQALRS